MYYIYTKSTGITYYDFGAAKQKFGGGQEFSGACAEALQVVPEPQPPYDVILVDEAQDLPPAFLQLCYRFLKPPKRLVYAYDELQSLTNASLPAPEELFGADARGRPLVTFAPDRPGRPRQDIILERCYRNSRPILATAHALGFGIYRTGGLIQIFDQAQLWLDVGYRVVAGQLADNHTVSLARTPETSPEFLESHSPIDDLIVFRRFGTSEEQDNWLVSEILKNLREDELTAEDIIVINPDPLKTRKAVAYARSRLYTEGINSSLAGVSGSPDIFFEPDVITFTGIFRAKGNEAAMVYVINAHDCFESFHPTGLTRVRNQLFTGMTRAKAWVRVLGIGHQMDALIEEYTRIRENNYTLTFTYPDEKRRQELRIVNRDMTKTEQDRISRRINELSNVLEALEHGDVRVEDLPISVRNRLRDLLG